ncbi:MAG TPA: beta-ketoacyl-[acyl-carrier-protein] synthase family protein [Terriglobales bacterium]|nr:beta-ketoacyl-[acyl-carrier-protein] synthase family protein [Terriglobales bacterium]
MRRVVVTAAGSINALGRGVAAFAAALREGRSGIGEISLFDPTGYRTRYAAQVAELEPPAGLSPAVLRRASRSDLLALVAAEEALRSSGWQGERDGIGLVLGGSTGGMLASEEYCRRTTLGIAGAKPSMALGTPVSTSGDFVAHVYGCHGPRLAISTACSSGGNALGIAADWIRQGKAQAVLSGGTDSLCRMTFSGFNSLQALDPAPCRPFDRDRAGLSLGEGAAMFLLEDLDHARARGARIQAELLGYGVSADAHHITQPRPDGGSAALALARALAESGVSRDDIDYVNAHGTATPANDATETRALKHCLGARAYRIPVSSTKSITGHCLAAAGAIEALACIIALREQFVPPTVGLVHPDPECDLDYVPGEARPTALRTVASSSYGFGGNNTTIVLRRFED